METYFIIYSIGMLFMIIIFSLNRYLDKLDDDFVDWNTSWGKVTQLITFTLWPIFIINSAYVFINNAIWYYQNNKGD